MEPNNFEKDFREKLNNRTIEPSDKAWDRLDAMLSITENKKSKKKNKWFYIAASFVGFLLVGTFFFNQKEQTIKVPQSVVVEDDIKKDSVVKPVSNSVDSIKTVIASSEQTSVPNSNNKQKSNTTLKNESNQVAESSIIIKNNQEKQSIPIQNQISKNENVDQLLVNAEKAVVAENSAKQKSKVKINADDLLNQVDGELELSFREKVISKVNKNYQTVKVALANRNQQE